MGGLDNCIGFKDRTNIKITCPVQDGLERVVYNGQKRFHALKFQAIVCADADLLHGYGPVKGRRHGWITVVGYPSTIGRKESDSLHPIGLG